MWTSWALWRRGTSEFGASGGGGEGGGFFIFGNRRQEGNFTYNDSLDVYDWVVDISLLGDLAKEGWKVVFSEPFYEKMIESGQLESTLLGADEPGDTSEGVDWQGWLAFALSTPARRRRAGSANCDVGHQGA